MTCPFESGQGHHKFKDLDPSQSQRLDTDDASATFQQLWEPVLELRMTKRHHSIEPVHPGELLREEIFPALKITKPALADALGVPLIETDMGLAL